VSAAQGLPAAPVVATMSATDEVDWVAALSLPGPAQDEAMSKLHRLMLRAAVHQVSRMRSQLPGVGPQVCEDIAHSAADDAITALLAKLSTFEGRSRFTTWAYKFAILQAATEVRRQSWAGREVALEDVDSWQDTFAGPEEQLEATDLAAALARAMDLALTPYQRKIAVALLVDGVPVDVLADRLATTRGALYKTLHMARGRLRAHLVGAGYLPASPTAHAGSGHLPHLQPRHVREPATKEVDA
jgi:RNA polymerase sigma-70 factor, ECF subfamily